VWNGVPEYLLCNASIYSNSWVMLLTSSLAIMCLKEHTLVIKMVNVIHDLLYTKGVILRSVRP